MSNFSLVNNTTSSGAQYRVSATNQSLNQTIQRLSSGLRINKSGDDAAGLAVANGYRSDASVLSQGIRNANDGISTLQIVDGGLNTISNLLDRASTLVVNFQSAESAIRDADVATEASNLARLSTLQQAGIAALAQANQSGNAVLSLLR